MPVSIVIGGQFGSEGKGKVALAICRQEKAAAVVRVGGTNSGHTVIAQDGRVCAFRQLPAAIVDRAAVAVLPSGSYIDVAILLQEIEFLKLDAEQVCISPYAKIILDEHKRWEIDGALQDAIGSTQSGTGAAVIAAAARGTAPSQLPTVEAKDHPDLRRFVRDATPFLRSLLASGSRVVIEGTQGFGLSVLHGGAWPKATSRDTTAAGFLAEAGLSPLDVDDITMVVRTYPIRVAGASGPLPSEITWSEVAARAGLPADYKELTTATQRVRRVANFDAHIVRRAIEHNRPSRIVLNHLDYIDAEVRHGVLTRKAQEFIQTVEKSIGQSVDWVGTSRSHFLELHRNSPQQSTSASSIRIH
jgi:adenylosuccinate synthase